jgi:hypothetical protein
MVVVAAPSAAIAQGVARERAVAIAKRAATARVERFGISYSPLAWRAACDRRSGGEWRCQVGTFGQCSGVVVVAGTSVRPRVRRVDVSCFD